MRLLVLVLLSTLGPLLSAESCFRPVFRAVGERKKKRKTDDNGSSEKLHAASTQRYPQSDPTDRRGQQPGAGEGEL